MLSIRYGLQKHFEKMLKVDTVNLSEFNGGNNELNAILVKLKHDGKSCCWLQESSISRGFENKLYEHYDLSTPYGLQSKVFVDFMIYFCNRGREYLRDIEKSDFIFDEKDYFILMREMAAKIHQGDVGDEESQDGRIYKTGKISKNILPWNCLAKWSGIR